MLNVWRCFQLRIISWKICQKVLPASHLSGLSESITFNMQDSGKTPYSMRYFHQYNLKIPKINVFSCPGGLNNWHCRSLNSPLESTDNFNTTMTTITIMTTITTITTITTQTWDLSKILHDRIFRPKILQTKSACIATIFTHNKTV